MGFQSYNDVQKRIGWLLKMNEVLKESDEGVAESGVELYFVGEDDSCFKTVILHQPYFYIKCVSDEETSYGLIKKYYDKKISSIETVQKTELEERHHLMGVTEKLLKVAFRNTAQMKETASDLKSRSFEIGKIYEEDIDYLVRFIIDRKLHAGLWYNVSSIEGKTIIKLIADKEIRPEPRAFAFDIETSKKPLYFPDASEDPIMMISAMFDGKGYLITNREWISEDIPDFTYTPKEEYHGEFSTFNERDEPSLLKRFYSLIRESKPVFYITYNGDSFDWPYVEKRSEINGINMFEEIGVELTSNTYTASYASHIDVYKWVERDSYLPVGSQNLKAVTEVKLGYLPLELDPEKMVEFGRTNPFYLSSYCVSDSLSTYYLYLSQVSSFIISMANILPYNIDDVLRKGTGTLCEGLLMIEAHKKDILIPKKSRDTEQKFHNNHLITSETYAGGYVETIEVGIFRDDIPLQFTIKKETLFDLCNELDSICDYVFQSRGIKKEDIIDYQEKRGEFINCLMSQEKKNQKECPRIFHFDIAAMYPNIILTNRLQPFAIKSINDCAACEYNTPNARCQRTMDWKWRIECSSSTKREYEKLMDEQDVSSFSKFTQKKDEIKKLEKYTKNTYRKAKIKEIIEKTETVCMREDPFYIDTVRLFRDKRYVYKNLLKVQKKKAKTNESQRLISLYDSLQLAHKCILNSFYGYVMRQGARWHSIEMAGIVCKIGTEIIKTSKVFLEKIGRPIELDTDGIWSMIPTNFPSKINFTLQSGEKFSFSYVLELLNYRVQNEFKNNQYYQDGEYRTENSIFFELDGPYRAMFVPGSTEEGKMLKKRYIVFDNAGKIVEMKGFEIKRRGELKIIKNIQKELFPVFLSGNNMDECYKNLADSAMKWLGILKTKGKDFKDDYIIELLSESKNMSKNIEEYGKQKSCVITASKRLIELFPGMGSLKGLSCRYLVTQTPTGSKITDRAIPAQLFVVDNETKAYFIKKWTEKKIDGDNILKDILDWEYYKERIENLVMKIISIPAYYQGIKNILPDVSLPKWVKEKQIKNTLLTSFIKKVPSKKKDYIPDEIVKKEVERIMHIKHIDKNIYTVWKITKEGIIKKDIKTEKLPPNNLQNNLLNDYTILPALSHCNFDKMSETMIKPKLPPLFIFYAQSKNRRFCAIFVDSNVFVNIMDKQRCILAIKDVPEQTSIETSYHATEKLFIKAINEKLSAIFNDRIITIDSNISIDSLSETIKILKTNPYIIHPSNKTFPTLTWQQVLFTRANDINKTIKDYIEKSLEMAEKLQIPVCNLRGCRSESAFNLVFSSNLYEGNNLIMHPDSKREIKAVIDKDTKGLFDNYCIEIQLKRVCLNSILNCLKIRKSLSIEDTIEGSSFTVLKRFLTDHINILPSSILDNLYDMIMKTPLLNAEVKSHISLLCDSFSTYLEAELENINAKLIHSSTDKIIISTGKKNEEGIIMFIDHLKKKLFNTRRTQLFIHRLYKIL
eukprot:GHVP01029742.1.p1 GENE.GHVP01029742.1~~GHVP01029742.1.p1  ORF type:complete len:1499 (+),score=286.83 GHVP01029742.1:49-4497(+)